MDNTTIPGKWYANLDTLGDQIPITTPPTGTLKWYMTAPDSKGAASKTVDGTRSPISRCDSPADNFGVGYTPAGRVSHRCAPAASRRSRSSYYYRISDGVATNHDRSSGLLGRHSQGKRNAIHVQHMTGRLHSGSTPLSSPRLDWNRPTAGLDFLDFDDPVDADIYGGRTLRSSTSREVRQRVNVYAVLIR